MAGARSWARRQAGGIGLTLACIPVGWFASAAVLGREAPVRAAVLGPPPAAPVRFDARTARAPLPPHASLVARVRADRVRVHRRPNRRSRDRVVRARVLEGRELPLVLLVRGRRRGWLRVDLPSRPNGSTGWIRSRDARLRVTSYRVRVDLRRHRLTVFRGSRRVLRRRIGVGRSLSPTPRGRYFVTDLVKARDPAGVYGPYALGLSAHSPVYTTFGSGNGQIGIHGTNDPAGLGRDVSSGCIRVANGVIRRLARELPLGTPVAIGR